MSYSIFTYSSHTEYVKRESIVIAWVKKNSFLFLFTNSFFLFLKMKLENLRLFFYLENDKVSEI